MSDTTGAGSPADNTAGAGDTNSATAGAAADTTAAGITPAAQAIIDRLTAERKAANDEAAAYRVEKKKREEEALVAAGKLSEHNANLQKERDALSAENAAIKAEADAAKARLAAIETARKAELLAKLPEAVRKNYEGFGLDVLERVSADFALTSPASSQGSDRGSGSGDHYDITKMTQTQLLELMRTNPTAYAKLMKG